MDGLLWAIVQTDLVCFLNICQMCWRHPEVTFLCDLCGKFFSTKQNVDTHVQSQHTGTCETFACEICRKLFNKKSNLKRHKLASHVEAGRHFLCNVCGMQFTRSNVFKDHIDAHSGDVTFTCDVCNKNFSSRSNLNRHKDLHGEVKLHRCNCGALFSMHYSLSRHLNICRRLRKDTMNLEHDCFCVKTYRGNSKLQRHQRHFGASEREVPESQDGQEKPLDLSEKPLDLSVTNWDVGGAKLDE